MIKFNLINLATIFGKKSVFYIKTYIWHFTNFFLIKKIQNIQLYKSGSEINAVIFSKDRAIQLHALLSSFFDTKIGECGAVVIYVASTEAHKKAYDEVAIIFQKRVKFVEEVLFPSFKSCLVHTVSGFSSGKVFFLVDDILFTEMVDYQFLSSLDLAETIFSLRMGEHLTYSYVLASKQPLPKSLEFKKDYLTWKWREGLFDWGYPLSVDGHIFSIPEVLLWSIHLKYSSPSSFEGSLQRLRSIYLFKRGMSFRKSRLVNIPANRVQSEVDNFHGLVHQDDLLQKWNDQLAINHSKFIGWNNYSVHQEADFEFVRRDYNVK